MLCRSFVHGITRFGWASQGSLDFAACTFASRLLLLCFLCTQLDVHYRAWRGDETHWALTVTVTDMHSAGPQKPPDRPPTARSCLTTQADLHSLFTHRLGLACGPVLGSKPQLQVLRPFHWFTHPQSRALRQFGAIVSPLVIMNRRGARLAEALSISMNPLRLSRRKAKAAAAAAAAAEAAAGQDSGGSSGGAAGGSGTTSVVSAPDWPPMQQQPAVASERQQQSLPKPKRRRPRPPEGQQHPLQQGEQREQQPQPAPLAQQAAPSSSSLAASNGDVRAFLRKSGGGTKLPLSSWEDADAAAKRQQAQLIRQVGGLGGYSWVSCKRQCLPRLAPAHWLGRCCSCWLAPFTRSLPCPLPLSGGPQAQAPG